MCIRDRYVVANKEKALDAGVLLLGHLVKGESIISVSYTHLDVYKRQHELHSQHKYF